MDKKRKLKDKEFINDYNIDEPIIIKKRDNLHKNNLIETKKFDQIIDLTNQNDNLIKKRKSFKNDKNDNNSESILFEYILPNEIWKEILEYIFVKYTIQGVTNQDNYLLLESITKKFIFEEWKKMRLISKGCYKVCNIIKSYKFNFDTKELTTQFPFGFPQNQLLKWSYTIENPLDDKIKFDKWVENVEYIKIYLKAPTFMISEYLRNFINIKYLHITFQSTRSIHEMNWSDLRYFKNLKKLSIKSELIQSKVPVGYMDLSETKIEEIDIKSSVFYSKFYINLPETLKIWKSNQILHINGKVPKLIECIIRQNMKICSISYGTPNLFLESKCLKTFSIDIDYLYNPFFSQDSLKSLINLETLIIYIKSKIEHESRIKLLMSTLKKLKNLIIIYAPTKSLLNLDIFSANNIETIQIIGASSSKIKIEPSNFPKVTNVIIRKSKSNSPVLDEQISLPIECFQSSLSLSVSSSIGNRRLPKLPNICFIEQPNFWLKISGTNY